MLPKRNGQYDVVEIFNDGDPREEPVRTVTDRVELSRNGVNSATSIIEAASKYGE